MLPRGNQCGGGTEDGMLHARTAPVWSAEAVGCRASGDFRTDRRASPNHVGQLGGGSQVVARFLQPVLGCLCAAGHHPRPRVDREGLAVRICGCGLAPDRSQPCASPEAFGAKPTIYLRKSAHAASSQRLSNSIGSCSRLNSSPSPVP